MHDGCTKCCFAFENAISECCHHCKHLCHAQAPGVGVATLVMGFDQIEPDLFRPGAAGHANSIPPQSVSAVTFEDTCPTVSSVTFDDDINLCRCPECRSGASASSRMQCFNPDSGEVDYYEESAHGNGSNDTPQSVAPPPPQNPKKQKN